MLLSGLRGYSLERERRVERLRTANVELTKLAMPGMTVDDATKLADRETYKVKQQRNRQRL